MASNVDGMMSCVAELREKCFNRNNDVVLSKSAECQNVSFSFYSKRLHSSKERPIINCFNTEVLLRLASRFRFRAQIQCPNLSGFRKSSLLISTSSSLINKGEMNLNDAYSKVHDLYSKAALSAYLNLIPIGLECDEAKSLRLVREINKIYPPAKGRAPGL